MVAELSSRIKFIRFILIGGLTFGIYEGLFVLLTYTNMPIVFVVSASYTIAVTVHFFLNRRHTFGGFETNLRRQIWKYMTVTILNVIIQTLIIHKLITENSLSILVASSIGAVTTTTFSFFLMELWVFKKGLK